MTLRDKLVAFWYESYASDRIAFGLEMTNFFFSVGASIALALSAQHPHMAVIYPFYFVGSISQVVASMRRGQPWVMLVTMWFSCMNVLGWLRAMSYL
mgnify:CR=1 FL=1